MTAEQVFEILPDFKTQLDSILDGSRGVSDDWPTYENAKSLTRQAVGFYAKDDRVRSSAAYEAIIKYICERLDL